MPQPQEEQDSGIVSRIGAYCGATLAKFLSQPRPNYRTFSTLSEHDLRACLQPGDLILVEGNSRISTAIKYLTQSTWSHVCLYIGEQDGLEPILEADLVEGVITVGLNKYEGFNLRICRPISIEEEDVKALLDFAISRLGHQYDKKNVFDLMRYLLPIPPVPNRYRRKLLEFGSGDPTKAICSTLVAQAFQSIRYPILPLADGPLADEPSTDKPSTDRAFSKQKRAYSARHFSHFTPRDFDLSPYFEVIKPTLRRGFNYKDIQWRD
ncbi:YiiX/YebB-like N1pC/P60 family cysteine hydrolase [Glaciecola siphonariae]|uniref:YiiX/YebB-like N1pC/P60 family cysteine hydrolase n=1 Tax=Glaciecola siphonariae TaxID=521012 RepID=A0ABV9LUB3_9ALTE